LIIQIKKYGHHPRVIHVNYM